MLNARLFSIISSASREPSRVRHDVRELSELYEQGAGSQLPPADVLVIESDSESGVLLYRFTRHGEFGGDTWHQNLDDAKHQAQFECQEALGEWTEVPTEVADAKDFAIQASQGH